MTRPLFVPGLVSDCLLINKLTNSNCKYSATTFAIVLRKHIFADADWSILGRFEKACGTIWSRQQFVGIIRSQILPETALGKHWAMCHNPIGILLTIGDLLVIAQDLLSLLNRAKVSASNKWYSQMMLPLLTLWASVYLIDANDSFWNSGSIGI